MFDFNASINDVTPVSPMVFPVDLMEMKKVNLWILFARCLYYVHFLN